MQKKSNKINKKQYTVQNPTEDKGMKLHYSFLTLVLLCCMAHIGISAFYNVSKTINYHAKIAKMKALKQQAIQENARLKEELENFSSLKSLEAIARTNLKMAGEDEVLVIINKPEHQRAQEEQSTVILPKEQQKPKTMAEKIVQKIEKLFND